MSDVTSSTANTDAAQAPQIENYLDYRAFVRDWMETRRSGRRVVSYAWVARRAGCTPGHVKNVLDGRRKLQGPLVDGFCRALRLDEAESAFFLALIRFNDASEPGDVVVALEELTRLQRRDAPQGQQFRYMSRWYYIAIRALAFCRGFREDPAWIATALRGQVTPAEAAEALSTLREMGLLAGQGSERPKNDAIKLLSVWLRPAMGLRLHMDTLAQAQQALGDEPMPEFRALVVALPQSYTDRLHAATSKFVQEITELMDDEDETAAGQQPGHVMRASLQFYPVTTTFKTKRVR